MAGDRLVPEDPLQEAPRVSFSRGFRNRHPLVLIVAALFVAAALAAFEAGIVAGEFTVIPQGRLLRITHDDYVHVTYTVGELRHTRPSRPVVYLFGGSGAMECFTSEAELAARIGAAAGGEVSVVSLAAHGQSLAQTLAIVDNLPPGAGRGLIAVGIAPMRFTVSPKEDSRLLTGKPMPLESPRLEAIMAREGFEPRKYLGVLPGVFDYITNYLQARTSGPPPWFESLVYLHHYYGTGPVYPLWKKARGAAEDIAADKALYPRYSGYNLRMLAQVTALARERGYSVLWFDQPINLTAAAAAGEPTWGGVLPASRTATAALAEKMAVPYLHLQRPARIVNADFSDLYHLVLSGRLKWQPVMAEQFGTWLRLYGAMQPGPADVQAAPGGGQ